MGLPTFVREWLKTRYLHCFKFSLDGVPTVAIKDLMEDIKFIPPDANYSTVGDVVGYFVSKIKAILFKPGTSIRTLIVMVDRAPPPIKRLVTHGPRYKGKDVLSAEEGPYLGAHDTDLLFDGPWIRFAGNYKLLQRELYPRLFNALMTLQVKPGQMLILHGFPGYTEWTTVHYQHAYSTVGNGRGQVLQVHTWCTASELPLTEARERNDPDLYNRVFINEHVAPCAEHPRGFIRREEWAEARNDIAEADAAMFYYDHWFGNENVLLMCNDGDVFIYGLLYAYERLVQANNTFRNQHHLRIPFKVKKGTEYFGTGPVPPYEYVDFNALYVAVNEDPIMRAAGMQHNVASLCFLMILAETDFFKGHMKGLGKDTIVWTTFMDHLRFFTHLVQMSKGVVPDSRTPRTSIIDADLFIQFVNLCYAEKYTSKKKSKEDQTHEQIEATCNATKNAQKDPDYCMPSTETKRVWYARAKWNFEYIVNTLRGNQHSPDPFKQLDGQSYYGYVRLPDGSAAVAERVCDRDYEAVDEVFAQHLLKNRKHGGKPTLTEDKKRKIVEAFE